MTGAVVFRVESGLFFVNADHVRASVRALAGPGVRRAVFDGQTTPWTDLTGAEMLQLLRRDLARQDVDLRVVHPVGQVRDVLARALGQEERPAVIPTVDEAARPDQQGRAVHLPEARHHRRELLEELSGTAPSIPTRAGTWPT